MYVDLKARPDASYRPDAVAVTHPVGTGRYAGTERRPTSADPAWTAYLSSARTRLERYEAHDVIFHEDDSADHVYLVMRGQVMLYRLLADGRRQVVDILAEGDLFGMSMSGIYDCYAETLVPAEIRILDRRDIERSGELQGHVNRCLMHRVEALHSHAVLLGRKSAQERVASFLMRFVPGRGEVGCAGPSAGSDEKVVVLRMTRQEIADYLGLTIETVSRVLSDMKRRGIIAIEKNDRIRLPSVCRICKLTGIH
ncbi:Crp/Fnr family transcriptional regulator [Chthonobacter albigriseus]|uniref:Crp/Fnr family transcriptional regulator n=1 Tax=Chthonobacter albigriseus TaxID=1683161 RepID=UPI0015EEFF8E|nr:Crp/Fnr family transcriptional regulator [Chthonobacter albigriseus]